MSGFSVQCVSILYELVQESTCIGLAELFTRPSRLKPNPQERKTRMTIVVPHVVQHSLKLARSVGKTGIASCRIARTVVKRMHRSLPPVTLVAE